MTKDQNTIGNATAQRSELHRKIWAIAGKEEIEKNDLPCPFQLM